MTENYYTVLGINNTCSSDDIKTAYRELAVKWHPDKNKSMDKKDIESKFRNITKAYQILSNPKTRETYDKHGITQNTDILIDPYSLFSNMFDNDDVPDVIVYIDADINKLYTGYTDTVNYIRYSECLKCDCTGTYDKINSDCGNCSGKGVLMETISGGEMGYMINEKQCDTCNGSGIDPCVKKCKKCDGNKYIKENIECLIDIPAGAYDGYYITLEDEGNYIPISDRKTYRIRSDVKFIIKEIIPQDTHIFRGVFIKELKHIDRADILLDVDITFAESLSGIKKRDKLYL
jgi:DnaJ-class molecular chaperone